MIQDCDLANKNQRPRYKEVYSVPRRFDLASMLVVTAGFALLFTCMTVLDFGFWVFLYFASLIASVGIAQSVFATGRDPRSVSRFSGFGFQVAVTVLVFLLAMCIPDDFSGGRTNWRWKSMICPMASLTVISPVLGYLSGALVAGAFLVSDYLRSFLGILHLHRNFDPEIQAKNSPWDDDEI